MLRPIPLILGLGAVLCGVVPRSANAQFAPLAGESKTSQPYENYDVRDAALAADPAAVAIQAKYQPKVAGRARGNAAAVLKRSMAAAQATLKASLPALQVEANRFGTAPEIIGTADARTFLTPRSTEPREAVLRGFLAQNAAAYGLTAEEAAGLTKFSDYANPAGNLSWVGLKQEINGLPVFQGEMLAAFTAHGALARTTSNLAVGLDPASLPLVAALTPAQAAASAAATVGRTVNPANLRLHSTEQNDRVTYLGSGPYVREIRTELIYFPTGPGAAALAYSMVLWEKVNAYYLIVDANDGTLLWRKNITQDQTQAATYNVYTGVSPTPLTPSTVLPGQGTQPPEVARTNVTLIADDLNASPLGWLTDGTNTTVGNNVKAGIDVVAPNGIDSNVTGNNRVFSFDYNPAPGLSGALGSTTPSDANYRNGIVTNLFFWTNRYHDRLYNLGFTESARNFQTTNTFTINGVVTNRGGVGNDPVLAESQDYSGTNNANFSTPADGSSGRMQMYLFTNTTPQRDGSLDTDVFLHEMTHGTSNRLHSNGSGLATQQSGGMGEGWSDYYARCLLSRADEDVTGLFPSGGYVTYELGGPGFHDNYYYGIREFPYAVKANLGPNGKPHNPLTFGVIDIAQTNGLSNAAFASSPVIGIYANEVHNIGFFWCTTLLEMRARMIQRLGWAVGNQRALQIVTDAMKLDVASPTILQARDSIIAADNAAYAGDDVPDIRTAFAIRGVGVSASTTTVSTYFFNIVESFYPSSAAGTITFSDSLGNNNGVADPGEDLVFTVPLTNRLTVSDANVTATLGSDSASYGTLAANASATRTLRYHVPATAVVGSVLQVPFSVSSANGVSYTPIALRIGSPTVTTELAQDFNGTAAGSLPAGWTQTGTVAGSTWSVNSTVIDGGNCAFAADTASVSDSSLVSPAVVLNGNPNQQISFKHRYTLETSGGIGYDGAVLEISIAGGAFADIVTAGGSWVQGGYGEQITGSATGNPLIGRRAWSGPLTTTATVTANLPATAAGQSVQFRWRLGSDNSTVGTGWYIDTVQVYSTAYSSATIDSDGDGMPDGYETANGLNPNDPSDASLDTDGDGVSNLNEYLAGTNPRSAADVLQITRTTANQSGDLTLTFTSATTRVYWLEYSDDLTTHTWTRLPGTYSGTGSPISITLPQAVLNRPSRFYRVQADFP